MKSHYVPGILQIKVDRLILWGVFSAAFYYWESSPWDYTPIKWYNQDSVLQLLAVSKSYIHVQERKSFPSPSHAPRTFSLHTYIITEDTDQQLRLQPSESLRLHLNLDLTLLMGLNVSGSQFPQHKLRNLFTWFTKFWGGFSEAVSEAT